MLVTATVGTMSTTAVDPVRAIGEICREQGLWLHVDAAYAGAAAVCPEYRWLNDGAELVDSYCVDPHKWLLTGGDCDAFWVADRAELTAALSIVPEFLRNAASESGAVIDYRDWQVPLGRRFRSLKLWFVLRWYGAEGLRAHIRHQVALAQEFAAGVAADPGFELAALHPLSLVCFRLTGPDADRRTEDLLVRCNATRRMLLTHTRVAGRYTIRLAVGADPASPKAQALLAGTAQYWEGVRKSADANQDGQVTLDEYLLAVHDADIFEQYVRRYAETQTALVDLNDDGYVERAEFIACLQAVGFIHTEAASIYSQLDADDTGRVANTAFVECVAEGAGAAVRRCGCRRC